MNTAVIQVAIVETNVFGAKAWHARCLGCKWESKRQDRQSLAVTAAKAHRCGRHKKPAWPTPEK